jgi:hypothetical protein
MIIFQFSIDVKRDRRVELVLPSEAPTGMVDLVVSVYPHRPERPRSLGAARPGHDPDALQRQIDATDAQIDRLVYELYGLTDEEIRLVEEATAT